MPTITLDKIREDITKKYEPLTIPFGVGDSVTLLLPMRMPKEQRRELNRLQENRTAEARKREADQKAAAEAGIELPADEGSEDRTLEYLREFIRVVAANRASADRLVEAVGDDLAVLNEITEEYGKATQLGEASPSPS